MFRAWDKDSSKMFYSENNNTEEMYFNFKNREIQLLCPVEDDYPEVRDCEIMQYIGLKDINGIDICEGDLISLGDDIYNEDGEPDIKEVVFDEDTASFRIYDYMGYQGSSLAEKWFIDDVIDNLEVIGNIYENPELLDDKV
jgi:uncharacterized phage protein (TIGR01671 family)